MNVELKIFGSETALAERAAADWLAAVSDTQGLFSVALSGGRIAKAFYGEIVAQAQAREVGVEKVHFFWADERCVSPEDPESNFLIARQHLFEPLGIRAENIHRVLGELGGETAALEASRELARVMSRSGGKMPELDLVILGMGEDGHVASLFPGGLEGKSGSEPYCFVENSPKPPPVRVSLSYAAIAAARAVWVLVSGKGKEKALRKSLEGDATPLGWVLKLRSGTTLYSSVAG